ncbi:MAG: formate--tetrahydrofolate ligase [Bacillota bacterium]|nr:formate--tetrahydrofolate ligase [Bacillota bacterium]MDD4264084.1 formate--tetrahydrofolate ligase [Bacillota bacterium]
MKTDIEIAQEAKLLSIEKIAAKIGIAESNLEKYGPYKAKLSLETKGKKSGKLILVTAITPTPAGEGKTCTAIGLTQGLGEIGKESMVCLREPALGPTFGIKGGAAGGGYAQVVPMEDINLHFTGDIHAITAAHNLLADLIDNHIHFGNKLNLDPAEVTWPLVMDMNYRHLRNIVLGLGGKVDGRPRQTNFDITVASEIMAILCLAKDIEDLKERLSRMIIGYTYEGDPVTAGKIGGIGAMAILLKDAIKPNLVQTLEGQPAFIHGGPFANIAHGNNSIIATKMALTLSDYVVTEGGFGSDLGAEKFMDIVAGYSGLKPNAVVVVATARALKMHGGVARDKVSEENVEALGVGLANLDKHVLNMESYGVPVVVAINRFPSDTDAELALIRSHLEKKGVRYALSEVVAKGGKGGQDLAQKVVEATEEPSNFTPLYDWNLPIKEKMEIIATKIYGADGVSYSKKAEDQISRYTKLGYDKLPLCVAKTQSSLSDDPTKKGAPKGWTLEVREVRISRGAGFLVPLTGTMMTMPGLPKEPAALNMDITKDGSITGLF